MCPVIISYMPTPKLCFPKQKSPKSGTRHNFCRTHQQTYPQINEINRATRFYGKITGQSTLRTSLTDSAHLRMPSADHARLSASSIISQHYCKLQSSRKCHLSCQQWRKTTSHGVLSLMFGNASFSMQMVLPVRDE